MRTDPAQEVVILYLEEVNNLVEIFVNMHGSLNLKTIWQLVQEVLCFFDVLLIIKSLTLDHQLRVKVWWQALVGHLPDTVEHPLLFLFVRFVIVHSLDDVGQRPRGKGEEDHSDELKQYAHESLKSCRNDYVSIAHRCQRLHGKVHRSCIQLHYFKVLEV